jgi:DNA-binding MarR family transcriptional regulator
VQAQGPLSLGRLAELEGIKPPSVSRQVDALLGAGLIRMERAGDRRVSMVAMTGAGAAELAAERRRYDAWLADRLALLETEDVAILREAIELFDRLVRS